jgi:hypothetical protein
MLNLVNVVGNILLVDWLLSNNFMKYGFTILEAFRNPGDQLHNPMHDVFPKVATCLFRKYSPGGDIINHNALCILSLNIINEKVYLIMMVWLMLLQVTTSLW